MSSNIKEIAQLAGVSKSTASRVLSGKGYASPEVRERVLEIAEKLLYKPNAVARAMVAKRTGNIGVIVFRDRPPIVSHPFYGKLIDAILTAAETKGYSIFLKTDQEMSLRSTDYMLEQRVDGLILISRLRKNVIDYVKRFNVPYLMVNGSSDDPDVIHLVSRDEEGGGQAAARLHASGHRRILVLAGPQEHRSHNLRLQGFCAELERLGLGAEGTLRIIHASESSFELGRRLMQEHMADYRQQAFSSIFSTNDMLALGAMQALLEAGVDIPGQAEIIGFDDVAFSSMYSPSLTSVHVDAAGMGQDAVSLLERLILGEQDVPKLNEYPCELRLRQSTGSVGMTQSFSEGPEFRNS